MDDLANHNASRFVLYKDATVKLQGGSIRVVVEIAIAIFECAHVDGDVDSVRLAVVS